MGASDDFLSRLSLKRQATEEEGFKIVLPVLWTVIETRQRVGGVAREGSVLCRGGDASA